MDGGRSHVIRVTRGASLYVAAVTVCAVLGFVLGVPWPILLAAAISLPASVVTLPAFYMVYGLLALVPGANPSMSTGSGSVDSSGAVISSVSTGLPSTWFAITTAVLGALALGLGAVLNVVIVRMLTAHRQRRAAVAHH
ncbi:MAG: hypothetical protein ABI249_02630 [Ornithinibacter sp.]